MGMKTNPSKLESYDTATLCRWSCMLNVFEWPEDFPIPKPEGWDTMTNRDRYDSEAGKTAWEALNEACPQQEANDYWNKVFLPNRNKLRHQKA